MYEPYVTTSEYHEMGYNTVAAEDLASFLKKASRHIDSLTFNRIQRFGWDALTEFQQEIIQETVCEQADFLYENRDALESIISSYSINGVSMQFGDGFNIRVEGGLPIKASLYKLLEQTGLCCRIAR